MKRIPVSIRALMVSILALGLAAIATNLLGKHAGAGFSLLQLAAMQGVIAAAISHVFRLPPWWLPIQLFFLPAAVAATSLNISASVYLSTFAAMLLIYWSTFRTRVPLYLSGRKTWDKVLAHLPDSGKFRFIDLGSGLGGLPLYLASARNEGEYTGVEIAPAPWFVSRIRAWWAGSKVRFMRMDYESLNLGEYDVVFTFLSPAAMPELWNKAKSEMKEGSLLFSLAFSIPGISPDFAVGKEDDARHMLYGWRMGPARNH